MPQKKVGILTAGGDCPGLNAAIRGFGKAAIREHGMELIGFQDGVRGLAEGRHIPLDGRALSGILTVGGTILGTSRDKVDRMVVDGETRDMVPTIVETSSMEEAVRSAYYLAHKGDTVLLSPACASFDLFQNYEDRGHQFKNCVRNL